MPTFPSFDGTEIYYESPGQGPAVLLVHGATTDSQRNWVEPGISAGLAAAGRRVVLMDCRGHGRSAKRDTRVRSVVLGGCSEDRLDVTGIAVPALFLTGEDDQIPGDVAPLVEQLAGSAWIRVPGDHSSAFRDPQFLQAILDFLTEVEIAAAA
jgi:pimeloyl-ACP methyl ester carboxylesterase